MFAGWKRIPPALLFALGAFAVWVVGELVYEVVTADSIETVKWPLINSGIAFTYKVLAICGLVELARGRSGRRALGTKLAIAGFAIEIMAVLGFELLSSHDHWTTETSASAIQYAYCVALVIQLVGLALAAAVSIPVMLGCVAIGVVSYPPPILMRPLYEALSVGEGQLLNTIVSTLQFATMFVLVARASRDRLPVPDPQRAIAGLRRVAGSFSLRLMAALAIPVVSLMLALVQGGAGALSIMQFALMAVAVVGVIVLVMFGLGAAGAAQGTVVDLDGIPLLVGSALALWCAGVTLRQLPQLYRVLYASGSSDYGHHASDTATAFSIVLPIVAVTAVVAVVTAIHRFASRRAFADLMRQATGNGMWFVMFSLTSVAVQLWLLPDARTNSGALILVLILATSGIVANVAMGRLCRSAADAIDREAGIPTATVVNGQP